MERKIGLKVHPDDNVATIFAHDITDGFALTIIDPEGCEEHLTVHGDIPYGHKVALNAIEKGAKIIKYGEVIGMASRDITKGDYVHVHNLDSTRGRGDLSEENV